MTDNRDARTAVAFRWFFATAGVTAFYIEMLMFEARPVIIGATLTMMGYPLAAWLDSIRRPSKDDEPKRKEGADR